MCETHKKSQISQQSWHLELFAHFTIFSSLSSKKKCNAQGIKKEDIKMCVYGLFS